MRGIHFLFAWMQMTRNCLLAVLVTVCIFGVALFSVQDASANNPQRRVLRVEIKSSYQEGEEYYKKGDKIKITVTFTGGIRVTGDSSLDTNPYIELDIGGRTRRASNDGTPNAYADTNRTMDFTYEIAEGDYDSDGIEIVANGLNDGDTGIRTIGRCHERGCSYGDDADLAHSAQGPLSDHKVLSDGALRFAAHPETVSSTDDDDNEYISGRLEIFDATESNDSHQWKWICDDSFGEDEAKVACNQIGHQTDDAALWTLPDTWLTVQSTGLAALGEAIYLARLMQIPALLDEVDCPFQYNFSSCAVFFTNRCIRTYQNSLLACDHDGRGTSDCEISESVGVTCKK